jgi:hypothetical protein
MKLRSEPAFATWLLKLFCSGPEHESVTGDLMEQYQQGRGRFWYWRQVLDIAFLALYCKAIRKPLNPANRIPISNALAAIVLIAGLAVALLSDIWPIFLAAILAGVVVGIVKFERGDRAEPPQANVPRTVRIDSSKIPIGGGLGAGILIIILLTATLHDLPDLRVLAIPGLLGGLVFAVVLHLWRRIHPRDASKDWLSIKPK